MIAFGKVINRHNRCGRGGSPRFPGGTGASRLRHNPGCGCAAPSFLRQLRRAAVPFVFVFAALAALPVLGLNDAEAVLEPEAEAASPPPYFLSPFDTVRISVYGQPDLNTTQRISDAGLVAMPLLGNIRIGGMTVRDAQKTIRNAFIEEELLRDPVVSLAIEEFAPKQVTLLGQVNRPGAITLPSGSNSIAIESAIAMAGGFTGTARRTRVRVTRHDAAEDRERVFQVDLDEILEQSDGDFSSTTFRVYPDDIIFVPQRLF